MTEGCVVFDAVALICGIRVEVSARAGEGLHYVKVCKELIDILRNLSKVYISIFPVFPLFGRFAGIAVLKDLTLSCGT